MVILNALQSILSIVFMILIGYILASKKIFDEETSKLFSWIVTRISLPPLMISNLLTNFTREKLESSGRGLIIPIASIILTYLTGIVISRIIKVKDGRKGVFRAMFFGSNAVFIGIPVNLVLFGESSMPYVLLYYIANTVTFWSIGAYNISKDNPENKRGIFTLDGLKKVFSPPLLGFIIGTCLVLLNIKLPQFALDTFKYMGNLTTPLSMLFIGIVIQSVNLKDIKFDRDLIALNIGRFVVAPLTIIMLAYLLPIPELMKKVFVIQSAMPIIVQSAIIAKSFGSDDEYAAVMITATTLASVIVIPIYMWILG